VAAALVKEYDISVFAINGEDKKTYYNHINQALDLSPHITMDDGADLVSTLHSKRRKLIDTVIGGTEETTTGVIRLRSMAVNKVLCYPIIAVNDANSKHLFDNRYGTGQSTLDGILRATNILFAGLNFVVAGYGWCGRGIAMRAEGAGAKVIICEVDPLRALEAIMDGYQVMPLKEAAKLGDVFVTATGDKGVIGREHFLLMKDGAIVALVQEYTLSNGRNIYLLAEGRLVNLAAAEGHPAMVMDMSFANQALCVLHLVKQGKNLKNEVYPVPERIDKEVARMKLKTLGVKIDSLTAEQKKYLTGWLEGT
jgi:adenosylhomocysteinase